ncbi:hypothetical protein L596_018091 [Steinernema carpocapsae]|uniref:SET domain-containing protein n=1 Tax=Steinernema carpocapsae TaxID=34508 RepID=A0A4U5N4C4_STECR|nr:hypothetical protein L596_018091 [Steinernema carpocapsae]
MDTSSSSSDKEIRKSRKNKKVATFLVDLDKLNIKIVYDDFKADGDSQFIVMDTVKAKRIKHYGRVVRKDKLEDDDDCVTHCDQCHKYYRVSCLEHPLYFVPDRQPRETVGSKQTLAVRSCPEFLTIRNSVLYQDAGKGVIAKSMIPTGTCFGPYVGVNKVTTNRDGYCWEIRSRPKNFYCDGQDENRSNWMRFINSALDETMQNLIAFQFNQQIYYRVYKPIFEGDELLVYYGERFSEELGTGMSSASCVSQRAPTKHTKQATGRDFIR